MATLNASLYALTYQCEMEWSIFMLADGHPYLAYKSAQLALSMAIHLRRPDLAYAANELMCAARCPELAAEVSP